MHLDFSQSTERKSVVKLLPFTKGCVGMCGGSKSQKYLYYGVALGIISTFHVVQSADQSQIRFPKDTQWLKLLKEQLKHEKNCDLSEILTHDEMKAGEEIVISGKILCLGGQRYEYTRLRQHLKFEFRVCDPTLC